MIFTFFIHCYVSLLILMNRASYNYLDMPKILIADDEPSLRLLVKATLSANKSYELVEAFDGTEALQKAQNELPDLILLDVMMPGLSGFEVCERLKNDPKTKKILIIMLTAKGQQSDRDWAISVGTDYFLTKPFSPIELFNLIEKILIKEENKEVETTNADRNLKQK